MTLEELTLAEGVLSKAVEALDAQQAALVDLRLSLQNYVIFLQKQIEELRDSKSRITRNIDEN